MTYGVGWTRGGRTLAVLLLMAGLAAPPGRATGQVVGAWADSVAARVSPESSVTVEAIVPDVTYPVSPTPALEPVMQERRTDPWGQPRNFGLAAFEALAANVLVWMQSDLMPSSPVSQVSPRSWWKNFEVGWQWDDSSFLTNHFMHPFHGGLYYGAARSNGFGYWTGLAFALAGSFQWECCAETHYMSINDWVNTGIGGAALGEALYRTSSMVLDNRATGRGRVLREVAAFFMSPSRVATRLITGNSGRVYDNPTEPADYVPERLDTRLSFGVRGSDAQRTGRGGELADDLPAHGFVNFTIEAGALTNLRPGHPFDWFTLEAQANFIRGHPFGLFQVHGNLWHRDLGRGGSTASGIALIQDFEYEDNAAFERGGTGVSLLYFREHEATPGTRHALRVGPTFTILHGINSELAFLAGVAGLRERQRKYDFGPGFGARIDYDWLIDGNRVIRTMYSARYIPTLNAIDPAKVEEIGLDPSQGLGSSHLTQTFRFRGVLPLTFLGLGAGFDYAYFHRRSKFDLDDIGLVRQSASQWQVFLKWDPRHVRNGEE